jgi:hypothetical protein
MIISRLMMVATRIGRPVLAGRVRGLIASSWSGQLPPGVVPWLE